MISNRLQKQTNANYCMPSIKNMPLKRSNLQIENSIAEEVKSTKKFDHTKELFASFSRTKPSTHRSLHYRTLSRNHILNISDTNDCSPYMKLSKTAKNEALSHFKDPELDSSINPRIGGYVKNLKQTKRSLTIAINMLKSHTSKDKDDAAATSMLKFMGLCF
ncbi:hypothetical protein MBANPS3_007813 [Mucor bainieri]